MEFVLVPSFFSFAAKPLQTHPYYIVAPTYDSVSAGNRVLYTLARHLERLGYRAFVARSDVGGAAFPQPSRDRQAIYLNADLLERHFRDGLKPIVIYPEIAQTLSRAGVRIFYMLNYPGLLGGAVDLPDCDYVLAYSKNIARSSPRYDQILHIPVSDPAYWTADAEQNREIVSVYAGKYVDHHHQTIPPSLSGALHITRHGADAPTRSELRSILQRSTCLHIFENTAVATEAALCGCPVIYHANPFFSEMIAEHEYGLDGFTQSDEIESINLARSYLNRFQENYAHAYAKILKGVADFAIATQRIARGQTYDRAFTMQEATLD